MEGLVGAGRLFASSTKWRVKTWRVDLRRVKFNEGRLKGDSPVVALARQRKPENPCFYSLNGSCVYVCLRVNEGNLFVVVVIVCIF